MCVCIYVCYLLSCVWLFVTLRTVAHQVIVSVHGILQAKILEWGAISFSRGSSWSRDQTQTLALQADSLPSEPPGKAVNYLYAIEQTQSDGPF